MIGTSRRNFHRRAMAGVALPWVAGLARSARGADGVDPALIVRSPKEFDAETPIASLDGPITPNRLFFVRSHHGVPGALPAASAWRLEVNGLVDRPIRLGLDDLKGLERVTAPALLQCSGNGRAFFNPKVPGAAWVRGAVGNAEWSGVRLADVLARAGVKADAAHLHLHGADVPADPNTPPFLRSIPLARALDRSTLLATTMNGEPLPTIHGGPIRLVVPGWSGNHWIKWLRAITVSNVEAPGPAMQVSYKIPKIPPAPGVDPAPADLVSITALNVKSLIARPLENAVLPSGRVEVRGLAWTGGDGIVTRVEVATGPDDLWSPADLPEDPKPGTWTPWSFAWDAKPGRYTLRSRATDSNGETQPDRPAWNKNGYLWNGVDRVACEVR